MNEFLKYIWVIIISIIIGFALMEFLILNDCKSKQSFELIYFQQSLSCEVISE